jgi:hypothetical protein
MIRFIPTPNVPHNIWVCPKEDKHAKILKDQEDRRKLAEAQAREQRKNKKK